MSNPIDDIVILSYNIDGDHIKDEVVDEIHKNLKKKY